jgi:DNA-binding MarR family transcriptional regulator
MNASETVARIRANWPEAFTVQAECVLLAQRMAALVQRSTREALDVHGLSLTGFEVLAALRSSPEPRVLNPSALYDALLLSSGGVTKVLKALEARGLIRRPEGSGDRRQRPIALTPAGRQLAERAMAAVMRADAAHLARASLSEAEYRRLARLLGDVVEGLESGR